MHLNTPHKNSKMRYPYDYIDSFDRFDEPRLPTKDQFNSILTEESISDEQYKHAQKVWNTF